MTIFVMLLSGMVHASSDPRVGCHDRLGSAPMREVLFADGPFSPCELERTAIVTGNVRLPFTKRLGRACFGETLPSEVAVVVPPAGSPAVYLANEKAEPFSPDEPSGVRIDVPSFRSSLHRSDESWRWSDPPRTLLVGEVAMREFLKRYPDSLRHLVGTGELTPAMLRRAIVLGTEIAGDEKVALLVDDSTTLGAWPHPAPRLFVFERDRDALEPLHRKVGLPVLFANGFRYERVGTKWIEGPGAKARDFVIERARQASFREFVREHPRALDALPAGLKLEDASAELVGLEGTDRSYWMIVSFFSDWELDQDGPQRLLYDPTTAEWLPREGPAAPRDAVFRTSRSERWGLNLGGESGWKALPSGSELDRRMNEIFLNDRKSP